MMKDILKGTSWVLSSRIFQTLISIPIGIIVARSLGPEGKGIYSLSIYLVGVLSLFGSLGLNIAYVYFVGQNSQDAKKAVSNSLWVSFVFGLLLAILYLIFSKEIHEKFISETPFYYELLGVLFLPVILLGTYLTSILLGLNKIASSSKVTIISTLTTLGAIILAWILNLGIVGFIVATMSSYIIIAVFDLSILDKLNTVSLQKFDYRFFKKTVKFGLKGYGANLAQFLNYRLDFFLVGFFLNLTSVGIYSVATTLAESVWHFSSSIATVLFSAVSNSRETQAKELTPRICRNALAISFFGALGLVLIGKMAIKTLFGEDFSGAIQPLIILMPGVVIFVIANVLASDLAGQGRPEFNAIASILSLVTTIVLDLLLIPRLGISGAALASTFSYSVAALFILVVYVRLTKIPVLDVVFLKREDLDSYAVFLKNQFSKFVGK